MLPNPFLDMPTPKSKPRKVADFDLVALNPAHNNPFMQGGDVVKPKVKAARKRTVARKHK